MNCQLLGTFSAPESPVMGINRKFSDKLLRVSGKRKLLLSPSKDLMIFFGNEAFNKLNPVRMDQKQKKSVKLVLDRKQVNNEENQSQKKNTFLQNRQIKTLSITNSTQSNQSKNRQVNESQQKLQKLKKQVDQIRRKYSYQKISQRSFVKSVDSQTLRLSTENSSRITNQSLKNSKEKRSLLTPKNDRYLGKRILTKNVFKEQKASSKLHLTNNKFTKTLKMNTKHSQEMRRNGSCQLKKMGQSINLSQEMTQTDHKQLLQFTFGSMAMMDFQSKQSKKGNSLKL